MAHLTEHMMFKGSRNLPPEYIDRLTDDVGGDNDASTDEDDTEYEEVAPANYLERLLWAEAERMTSLDVRPADFAAERKVVEQEQRDDALSDPYQRLLEVDAPRASFTRALYRQSVIGSVSDIEAVTPAELKAFHALHYRPDNASLVVVGNFDPAQLDRWIDQYFGPIARPTTALPRVETEEPARRAHRVFDSYAPDAPLPALLLTYVGPPASSPDAAALRVLNAVLTLGKTARLNVDLAGPRGLAESTFSEVDLWKRAGLIQVGVTLTDGVSMARGEAALRSELARLRAGGVAEAEVRAAKNQLLASRLSDRETIDGIAGEIGETSVLEGDATHVNTDLTALAAVTAADVRRVANTYLVDTLRVTIRCHDAPSPGVVAPRPRAALPAAAQSAADVARPAAAAASDDRESRTAAPPPIGPASAPVAPAPIERTLPNGMRIIVARTGLQPVATVALTFRGGSALDPGGKAGLADATTLLALRGPDAGAEIERARRFALLGDKLTTDTDDDSTGFRLTGLAASLPEALEAMARIVRRPQMDTAAVRGLPRRLSAIGLDPDSDLDAFTDAAIRQLTFGGGAYGHLPNGAPRPSATITASDVLHEAAILFRPQGAVLVITGGVDPASTLALAAEVFGDWARSPEPQPAPPSAGPLRPGRVVAIDVPGMPEAAVTIGRRSIARSDPSHYAVEVANELLGGGQSSRLSVEIRVRRGLTYDASSQLDEYGQMGLFTVSAQTRNDTAPEVAGLMLDQLNGLASAGPSPQELAARKTELIGGFYRNAESSDGLADLLTEDALYGVDLAEIGRYAERIGAVSAADVQAAARRLADPRDIDVLIVGDAAQFKDALHARFATATLVRGAGPGPILALGR
jgi:zinc protease